MSLKSNIAAVMITSGLVFAGAGAAFAQPDPGHPRVNEVERRIDAEQTRVDRGISDHQINGREARRDDARLARDQRILNRDMARDRGHITKAEQRGLNARLNHTSRVIHRQRVAGE
jgi:hypothetical protein